MTKANVKVNTDQLFADAMTRVEASVGEIVQKKLLDAMGVIRPAPAPPTASLPQAMDIVNGKFKDELIRLAQLYLDKTGLELRKVFFEYSNGVVTDALVDIGVSR